MFHNLASAQRVYDRAEPFDLADQGNTSIEHFKSVLSTRKANAEFFGLMESLHSQMDADPKAHQDISTAFVEEMFDAADDNTLMLKAMDSQTSDAELGAYVRLLMKIVARDRA